MSVFMHCERAIGLVRGNRLDLSASERAMLESLNYDGLAAAHAQDEALSCVRFFAGVRDALLRSYPWVFARKTAAPAQLAAPVRGWPYSYALPSDCLNLLAVVAGKTRGTLLARWETVGGAFGCEHSAVEIRYTARMDNPNLWDPAFSNVFCAKLAAAAVASVVGEINMIAQLEQLATSGIGEAFRSRAICGITGIPLEEWEWDGYIERDAGGSSK